MHPSSAGLRLWTLGRGDDTASWRATDIRLERFQGSMSSWFLENSRLPSHPRDPNPLMPLAQQQASANAGGYRWGATGGSVWRGLAGTSVREWVVGTAM